MPSSKRRDPLRGTDEPVDDVPAVLQERNKPRVPGKRTRDWEKEHKTASYRIPLELRDRITEIAGDLGVSTSDVARYFLEYALTAYDTKQLNPKPRPKGKYTLYE